MQIIKDSVRRNKKTLSGNHTHVMGKMPKDTQQEKARARHIITRQRRSKHTYITEGGVKKRYIGPITIQREAKNTKSINR